MNLFALSGCLWLLVFFLLSIRVRIFIIKRYEQETELLETVFFKEHAMFTRYIPFPLSSAIYTSHLLMCLWGWEIYKTKKMFRDIENPEIVIQHFSEKEISRVKWYAVVGIIFIFHIAIYYLLRFVYPEMLK